MIEREPGTDWRDLQIRVATILGECGLEAAAGKVVETARGRAEIDVWAIDPTTTPPSLYLCECKRWRSSVPQGEVQAFRTVVGDVGAHHGLFISAQGFQAGAYEVARHTNIHLKDWSEFQEMFVERWCRMFWIPTFTTETTRLMDYVDPVSSDAAIAEQSGHRPLEPEEAVGLMALSMYGWPFMQLRPSAPSSNAQLLPRAIWDLRNRYKRFLPTEASQARYLRELLDSLLAFCADWMRRTGRA